jgi:phosphopantothenoylcysteine decarboxylase/phosphopantothenate--cysteine ligase
MKKKQAKLNILITAGPTREFIDPVRFISNASTGTIGFCLADLAKKQGHNVVLLSGPTTLKDPRGVKTIRFNTALELNKLTERFFDWANCIICSAAVGDFRPVSIAKNKIKKNKGFAQLKLVKNPDILQNLGKKKKNKLLVGFALETADLKVNALKKLKAKNLDFIVANQLSESNVPFGKKEVTAYLIDGKMVEKHSKISKKRLARIILDRVVKLCYILLQPKKRR